MADFEPPSFSLGFDFHLDSEPLPAVREDPHEQAGPSSSCTSFLAIEDDDDVEIPTTVRPPEVSDPPRALELLRRRSGSDSKPESSSAARRKPVEMKCDSNDEIEGFSSQEDPCEENKLPSLHPYFGCSNSKFRLHGHRVLNTQLASKCKMTKTEHPSDFPASTSMETASNKFMFPKLTISPLRMFQLLDSDSDSDFASDCPTEYANTDVNKVNSFLKEKHHSSGQNPTTWRLKRREVSESLCQKQDLWDDFYTEKRFNIPTPALDEVREEYFRSVKNRARSPNTNGFRGSSKSKCCDQMPNILFNVEDHDKLGNPVPRVQNFVRSHLPYFFPLAAANGENKGSVPSVIDYMSQFNRKEGFIQQASENTDAGPTSKRGKKKLKKSNAREVPQDFGSWVDPRSCSTSIPKDSGRRQVHAFGQSAGHWFTSPEGKKVYVSKTGQELTGRMAYSHYRKESGRGFRRSGGGKKRAWKKKHAGKKKATARKR